MRDIWSEWHRCYCRHVHIRGRRPAMNQPEGVAVLGRSEMWIDVLLFTAYSALSWLAMIGHTNAFLAKHCQSQQMLAEPLLPQACRAQCTGLFVLITRWDCNVRWLLCSDQQFGILIHSILLFISDCYTHICLVAFMLRIIARFSEISDRFPSTL